MARVSIPFAKVWRSKMLDGRKTSTARTKKLGEPGDVFPAFDADFQLLEVVELPYAVIVREHYAEEGCRTENELRRAFMQIWWGKQPKEDRLLWLHRFKRVCGSCGALMSVDEGDYDTHSSYWCKRCPPPEPCSHVKET